MKKHLKKIKITILLILILFCSLTKSSLSHALTNTDLMELKVNGVTRTITRETTIDEIKSWYNGVIRLETKSAFGGSAYTFYTDNNYNGFLYIETTKEGKIISYGSVDESYVTKKNSYNDTFDYQDRTLLSGYTARISSTIKGRSIL